MSTPPPAPAPLRRRATHPPLTREAVSRALVNVSWPARAADLVHAAARHHARTEIVRALQDLPSGIYLGPNQVCRRLFGPTQPSP